MSLSSITNDLVRVAAIIFVVGSMIGAWMKPQYAAACIANIVAAVAVLWLARST